MPYYQGDPFFGAAAAMLAKKVLPKAAGVIKKVVTGKKTTAVLKAAEKGAVAGSIFGLGHTVGKRGAESDRKYRRINVGNAKALRRAIRRMQGFEKLARRVLTFSTGKSPGRGKFKRKRRAA